MVRVKTKIYLIFLISKGDYMSNKKKQRPVGNFYFAIEIDGIQEAQFNRASGIASEIELEAIEEGGVNHMVHYMPKRIKNSNIILEKGLTKSKELMLWYKKIQDGVMVKKNFSIMLYDTTGKKIRRWNFTKGYPIKWEVSDLDAMGNSVAIERIEIVHEGMKE